MKTGRVIARLDVKNDALVKGIHLEGLRVLGKPELFARHYYEHGIDELLFMDVVASLYGRNSLLELVQKTAKNIFVPLSVGGGVRTAEDVQALLSSGADKVVLNTAATKDPSLVNTLAEKFGTSTITIAIECIKDSSGKYYAYNDNGREPTGREVSMWAREVEARGAGEILLTSVDNEGTGRGMDKELIDMVACLVNIPVVAHGGVGSKEHVLSIFQHTDVDAVCLASILHYDAIRKIDTEAQKVVGNTSFLMSGASKKNLSVASVIEVKEFLIENRIPVRLGL